MRIAFIDGCFLPQEEAKIPITDRGFLFGDGVRATIKVDKGEPYFLPLHLSRLKEQCASIALIPPSIEEKTIFELIEKNGATEGVWRLKIIVTGGDDPSFHLPKRKWGHLILSLTPYFPPPFKPFSIGIFPQPIMTCHSSFKSLAHLNRFYMLDYAYQHGYDDCLSLTESKIVLEMAFGNIFWKVGDRCETPSPKLPLYFGVTLQKVGEEIERMGWPPFSFVTITPEEIPAHAHLYRTSTMMGVTPVTRIENRNFSRDKEFEQALVTALAQNDLVKKN